MSIISKHEITATTKKKIQKKNHLKFLIKEKQCDV